MQLLSFTSGLWRGSPVFGGSSTSGNAAKRFIALVGQAFLQPPHPTQVVTFTTGRVFRWRSLNLLANPGRFWVSKLICAKSPSI